MRNAGEWSQQQKLISPDGTADDRFGRGIAVNHDTLIVSAKNHNANVNTTNNDKSGAVYVYKRISNQWLYTKKIIAKGNGRNDQFGWNVALSDGAVVRYLTMMQRIVQVPLLPID